MESTGRYKLTNHKDGRYVNELGNFGTNAYSDDWNTYVLTELDGLFSIQNAGSAGTQFWTVEDNRMQPGDAERKDSYLFKIISYEEATPVEAADAESGISYKVDSGQIHVKSVSAIRCIRLLSTDGKVVSETKTGSILKKDGLTKNTYVLTVENENGKYSFKVQLP